MGRQPQIIDAIIVAHTVFVIQSTRWPRAVHVEPRETVAKIFSAADADHDIMVTLVNKTRDVASFVRAPFSNAILSARENSCMRIIA